MRPGCAVTSMPTCPAGLASSRPVAIRSLLAGAGYEGPHDVTGVPVEIVSSPVVARGSSRICVTGGDLDVAKGHARVQRGGDEAVA